MDFHILNRKELQSLCKKHGIKANLKNTEMADRLSSLFKEENPTKRGGSCLKNDEEEVVGSKESKRVKFCSENENETFWFEKTDPREMRLMARKKRGFPNSKDEENPVSVVEDNVQNDGFLEKPCERKLRRRSVVIKCNHISELKVVDDKVEKPIERNLRRKCAVVMSDQASESKMVDDTGEKRSRRNLRRKSAAVKSDQIPELNAVDDEEKKPVGRNLRQKSAVFKSDHVSESKVVDDEDDQQAIGRNLRNRSAVVKSDQASESKVVDDEAAKRVGRNLRRKSVVVKADKVLESKVVDDEAEKPVGRNLRRKSVVVKSDQIAESKRVDEEIEKPAGRNLRRKPVVVKSDPISESKTVDEKVEKPVERNLRRKPVVVKSDQISESKTVDEKAEKPVERNLRRKSVVVKSENVQEQEKSSEIASEIKKGKRRRTTTTNVKKQRVKKGRKVVAEDLMKENVDGGTDVVDKTCDNAVAVVPTPSSVTSVLQINGDIEVERFMQANKVDENSLHLNTAADNNYYEDAASTPKCVGELMSKGTTDPSLLRSCEVGDAAEQQPSSSLGKTRSVMMDRENFESSDGLQYYQNKFEESPCVDRSLKNANALEDKRFDCSVIFEEPDVQTSQDKAKSEEKAVLDPETDRETNVQTPVGVEGLIQTPTASASTRNKVMEEGKDINTVALCSNKERVSCISDAEGSQVVQSLNKDDGIVASPNSNASECISLSGKTKYSEQSFVDAAEGMKCDVSCSKTSNAGFGNFEDGGMADASHPVHRLLHIDVGNTCIEPLEHNYPPEHIIAAADKLDIHPKDDRFVELEGIPQKDNIHQSETLCDNDFAQSCELTNLSGSLGKERHIETPSTDLTCFANDGNVEYIDDEAKYITFEQTEEANCFDEPEFQHTISGVDKDAITDDLQSKELEFEGVTWTTEDLLALGGEVDESVVYQERKPADLESEGSTLQSDVYGSRDLSDRTKHFELKTVEDGEETDDDAATHGEYSVTILQGQEGEVAETSKLETAASIGGFIDSSNALSENNPIKQTVDPVSELGVHFYDDETSADQKSNSYSVPVELMGNQTPKALHDQDPSPKSREKTNPKIENDDIAAQESKFVGSAKKELVYCSQQVGSVQGATEEVNNAESEGLRINSEREGEELVRELTLQSSKLATVSKCSKTVGGDETVEECSLAATGLEHSVGQEKHSDKCGSPFDLVDNPMRNSGNFSLREVASRSDDAVECLDCPPFMDRKGTCYTADDYAAPCEIASESLQTSQVNICNGTQQNACIGDVDRLDSAGPIPFEDDQDNNGEMEPDAKSSNATPPETTLLDDMIPVALATEIHDGPGSTAGQDSVEYANTRERELKGLTGSPFSAVNQKLDDAKDNYEANIAELSDNASAMVESLAFGDDKKGNIEGASEYAPEEQRDKHMNAANDTKQENADGEQEEAACVNGNDDLVTSRSLDLLQCEMSEVSDVNTTIVHEKINSEAEVDFNANEACIGDVGGLHTGEFIPCEDDQGEMEPNAKSSNGTAPESMLLDDMISLALATEIHDGRESTAGQDMVEYADTRERELQSLTSSPFSAVNHELDDAKCNYEACIAELRDNDCSAMVESHALGDNKNGANDMEGASEYTPEGQIDNQMNLENGTRQENADEEQEEDASKNVYDDSVTSRSLDLLQCGTSEVSDVNTTIVHETFNSEAELDFNLNEGNRKSGEQFINQEHMGPIHTDAHMFEKDHIEVNSSGLERSPCAIFVMDSAPEHRDNGGSRSPACYPDVGLSQDNRGYSLEKEAHVEPLRSPFINASSGSLIATHDVLEYTISQTSVNASGAHEMTQEYLSGCPFSLFDQEKDGACCIGNSEANKDDAKDDISHLSLLGDRNGVKIDAKEEKVYDNSGADVPALSNAMDEDGKVAEEHTTGSPSPSVSESITVQAKQQNRFLLLPSSYQQMDHTESACQPGTFITALFKNEGLKSSGVFTDAEIDYLFCGEWETAKAEVRELQPSTSNVACPLNENEIPDEEIDDTVSTSQPAIEKILNPENLASGEQEQLSREASGDDKVLMSSVIQEKNSKNNAENEDMESNVVITDTEIDLLWGETTAKDEVSELQTEASDDRCPVNEYESAGVEDDKVDTHQPVLEKFLEPDLAVEEQKQVGDGEKEKRGDRVDLVHDVQNCTDDKVIQRKNDRSILIHATPQKLPLIMSDMKENTAPKNRKQVDVTSVKPIFKRKALQKLDK